MTVRELIIELEKIENKDLPVEFDCGNYHETVEASEILECQGIKTVFLGGKN